MSVNKKINNNIKGVYLFDGTNGDGIYTLDINFPNKLVHGTASFNLVGSFDGSSAILTTDLYGDIGNGEELLAGDCFYINADCTQVSLPAKNESYITGIDGEPGVMLPINARLNITLTTSGGTTEGLLVVALDYYAQDSDTYLYPSFVAE
jgi:hypothetical protein